MSNEKMPMKQINPLTLAGIGPATLHWIVVLAIELLFVFWGILKVAALLVATPLCAGYVDHVILKIEYWWFESIHGR